MEIGSLLPNNTYESNRWAAESALLNEKIENIERKARTVEGHAVTAAAKSKQDKKLKEACRGFEAMFLEIMYRQMRKTVPENTLFGKSHAQEIWEDMRDSEMMKNLAESGGLGLGDMLYRQLAPSVLAQENGTAAKSSGNVG